MEENAETLVYCKPQGQGAALTGLRYRASLPRKRAMEVRQRMRERLAQPEGARLYARRRVLSEAPFHVIKNLMGFRRFGLRGLQKVNLEWVLVAPAYNCRKIVATKAVTC